MAWAYMFGAGPYGNRSSDAINAKHHVIWGGDTAVSQKQLAHFFLEARDAGTELVVIDIAYRTMASKSDWFIPVHPATDGALALGAIREIFEQGWEATDFLRDHTEAPLLIKEDGMFLRMSDLGVEPTETTTNAQGQEIPVDPYVVWDEASSSAVPLAQATKPALGGVAPIEGIAVRTEMEMIREAVEPWTLEHTSEVTGVSVEDIQHLAHLYTQEGDVQTDMKFGLNPLQQRHVQLEMRQFPLARVRPDGSVGFGSVHRRAELWRGQRAGLHYDARAPRAKFPKASAPFSTGPTSAITSCPRAKSLARTSPSSLSMPLALTLFRIKRIRTRLWSS